ncbi:hypothetical protein C8A01DRAFT_41222 [Parachaetomium inaequale]|uniref:Uncharacterized protein n=1 Tax=Parachaetomium inaequale TaxID=2588326 RepID=A0AAN6PAA9_9PEZI|nr:hypothetical protein C8A01DRAFT_41222 [Parachaetomium inaequale]
MPKHTLYIAKRSPTTGPTFFEADSHLPDAPGIIFQLRGMPGGFYYPGPENLGATQDGGPGELRDKLEAGEVGVDESAGTQAAVDKIDGILKGVDVVKDESAAWNCQNWALEGFELLKKAGVVYGHLGGEGVRGWLKER